jgi:prefoldin subunit 5
LTDVVDLTVLSGLMQETQREMRLLRLQTDNLAARVGTLDQRLSTVDQRLATLEQAAHGIIGEMGRGFGQTQQQATRLEKRIDAVDAGLTALRAAMDASTDRIIAAIRSDKSD